jgi:Predicted membrane protein
MDGWTPLIVLHAVAATLAMVLGAVNLFRRRRGDLPHRVIGRTWLGAMYLTALSSFGIQELRPGRFSWIHALSVLTLVTLTLGLWHARRGHVAAHAGNMIGSYLGLIGAFIGVVAVPSRLIPQAFQSNWLGMATITALIVGAGLAFVAVVTRMLGGHVARVTSGDAVDTPVGTAQ